MNFIVAVDDNYAVGYKNDLLYNLKKDMHYFVETTRNKTVVMGENTFRSLPGCKPLRNRTNIVISIDPSFTAEGVIVVHSFKELASVLKNYDSDNVFVIGGASIYEQLMSYCKLAYITKIHATKPADRFIPNIESTGKWKLIFKSSTHTEEDYKFEFCIFKNTDIKPFVFD